MKRLMQMQSSLPLRDKIYTEDAVYRCNMCFLPSTSMIDVSSNVVSSRYLVGTFLSLHRNRSIACSDKYCEGSRSNLRQSMLHQPEISSLRSPERSTSRLPKCRVLGAYLKYQESRPLQILSRAVVCIDCFVA